jgi:pilus assembly protein CpaF
VVFSLVITEKSGAQRQLDFEGPEVSIGRLEDNDICLPKNNVSKQHARLVSKDDRIVLVDQKSTNGTYVNGRRISSPMVVRKGDKIYIGDFIITLVTGDSSVGKAPTRSVPETPQAGSPRVLVDAAKPAAHARPEQLQRPFAGATEPPGRGDERDTYEAAHDAHEAAVVELLGAESDAPEAAGTEIVTSLRPEAMSEAPPAMPSAMKGAMRPPPPPRELDSATASAQLHATRPLGLQTPSITPAMQPSAADELPEQALAKPAAEAPARPVPAMPAKPAAEAPIPLTSMKPATAALPPAPAAPPAARERKESRPGGPKSIPPWADDAGLTSPAAIAPSVRLQGALSMLMERLALKMDVTRDQEGAFPSEQQTTLERLIDELADEGAIGPDLDRRFVREAAVSEAVGLGPLDRLLANRSVREIVVDGPARILADLGGGLTPVTSFFSGSSAVLIIARRLLHRAGKTFDESVLAQEAQLPGGGFVQVLLPPLAPKGAMIALRCPPRAVHSADSMVTDGMLSSDMLALLRAAVHQHKNILVLGPLGAGVSTLLTAIAGLAPDHERVVSIEDAPSMSLALPRVLPLSRRALPGAKLEDVLKHAARLRADRLVIDDLTAADTLAALTTAASTTSVLIGTHAQNPSAALTQLEVFAQAALGGARVHLAPLLSNALQLLVHVGAGKDGMRRVQSISEVRGAREDTLEVRVLYRHDGSGFRATEHRASFLG